MANCLDCGQKLGLLSTRHILEDNSILCNSCFAKLKNQQAKEKESKMLPILQKYLKGKGEESFIIIKGISKSKEGNLKNYWDDHSLISIIEFYNYMLLDNERRKKSGLSSFEMDMHINLIRDIKLSLEFFGDLEMLFKLFNKKEINTDHSEILDILTKIVKEEDDKINQKQVVDPFYDEISKNLGDNISKERVIREYMRKSNMMILDSDTFNLVLDDAFITIAKILDKFNINYTKDEIVQLLTKIRNELELQNFEEGLGFKKEKNNLHEDFSNVDGYRFEAYLKNVFEGLGYTVIETPLSGDQGADLILSKDGVKIVVQAKRYKDKVSNKAVQEIAAARNHYKADKAIVVTNSSFTRSAVELALSNNVELWDGNKLDEMIRRSK